MSAAKHTPGPWFNSTLMVISRPENDPKDGSRTGFIADVRMRPRQDSPSAEGEANATLIAAAPDLLQAAKDIVRVLETEGMGGNCAELNAAIAKATGGGQ